MGTEDILSGDMGSLRRWGVFGLLFSFSALGLIRGEEIRIIRLILHAGERNAGDKLSSRSGVLAAGMTLWKSVDPLQGRGEHGKR